VKLSIGTDGRVRYAEGSGAPDILVKAAEENAREWVFGPFPPVFEFPVDHTVQYIYKLEGKPVVVAVPPTVRTFLPDRVEITATPLVTDYPPLQDYRSLQQSK